MPWTRVLLVLVLAGCAGRAPLRDLPPPSLLADAALSVEPIAPGVWHVLDEEPFPANSLLVETSDGTLVLCGSPYAEDTACALLAWIGAEFGPRPMIVVNTHFHPDALGGNSAFAAHGAETWGSDLTATLLRERGERVRRQVLAAVDGDPEQTTRFTAARYVPAEHTFALAEGVTFTLGDERVEVAHPGPAHALDNVVVWFPARRVLFAGCMVLTGPTAGNVVDADLVRWPASIERLRRFDADVVVPGHGPLGGPELLDHTQRVLSRAAER